MGERRIKKVLGECLLCHRCDGGAKRMMQAQSKRSGYIVAGREKECLG